MNTNKRDTQILTAILNNARDSITTIAKKPLLAANK